MAVGGSGQSRLLDGVLVLDLSMFVAGHFATIILADLGAEVIKIEPLRGDPVRTSGIGPEIGSESAQFQSYNRNKKSLCLDLKSDQGRAVFYDLIRKADIVFDTFRPGVLERLNLEYERLRDVNLGIISVSLSGFGQDGPWAERPGYDIIVQALSGAMSLTGQTASDPARISLHLGDTDGGLYGALAMSAALSSRQRTGEGCRLGLITPPLGLLLFICGPIARVSLERTALAVLPFLAAELIVLLLITFVKPVTMAIPNAL